MDNELPKRKHPRLDFYDYSNAGAYFVTICTQDKRCVLSRVVGQELAPAEIQYTPYGQIAQEQLLLLESRFPGVKVDQYVIMPNHLHVIFVLENDAAGASPRPTVADAAGASPRPTVMDVVCAFKSLTTRECKKVWPVKKLFQTSFYEHVIRGREDYDEIARYICENPTKWHLDELYRKEVL